MDTPPLKQYLRLAIALGAMIPRNVDLQELVRILLPRKHRLPNILHLIDVQIKLQTEIV